MVSETVSTSHGSFVQDVILVYLPYCHMILKVPLFRVAFLLCGLVMFLALADSVCDDQIVFRADPEEVHCLSCAS